MMFITIISGWQWWSIGHHRLWQPTHSDWSGFFWHCTRLRNWVASSIHQGYIFPKLDWVCDRNSNKELVYLEQITNNFNYT